MMIFAIVRTAIVSLRRDRGALALSFILPITFFSIFAVIFGGRRDTTPKVSVIVADDDHSRASERLVKGLQSEGSLVVKTRPAAIKDVEQPVYTATTAEAAVKAGTASVALVIPQGFGENPIAFGPRDSSRPTIQLLEDSSDMIAPQVVAGLLQKVGMTSLPDLMAEQGSKYFDQFAGGLTREQRERLDEGIRRLREREESGAAQADSAAGNNGMIAVTTRAVVGENKNSPMVSFYAAAIGVMFLLFTASGAAGALLDEAESGTLDRAGIAGHHDLVAFGQAGLQLGAGVLATAHYVFVGMGGIQARFLVAHSRICRDGSVYIRGSGVFRAAAGQHLPDARAARRVIDAHHFDHVFDWRQHVSALSDAGSDAKGGSADH
jgi:ABC-2 type transport system permease protein